MNSGVSFFVLPPAHNIPVSVLFGVPVFGTPVPNAASSLKSIRLCGNSLILADENENCINITMYSKMEIVSIERQVFERMVAKFEAYVRRVDEICRDNNEKRMGGWLDNQDVCRMLDISPRTLQTLRDNSTLAYSQINHKTYYRPEDVERILPVVEDRRKDALYRGKTI